MSVCFVISLSKNNGNCYQLSRDSLFAYCCRHGYDILHKFQSYSKYNDCQTILQLFSKYDYVVTIGVDIFIERPEIKLQELSRGPVTMGVQLGKDGSLIKENTFNGDFIIYKNCPQTIAILQTMKDQQLKYSSGQTYINNKIRDKISVCYQLQVAAPSMNQHVDYSHVDVSSFFCIHFHWIILRVPANVKAKQQYMRQYLLEKQRGSDAHTPQ